MEYLGGIKDIGSPRLREADYLSLDLDGHYLLEQWAIELKDNPYQIEDMPRGTMKNPTTVKMILMDAEIPNKQEEPAPYIDRIGYAGPAAASERASRFFPQLGGLTDVEPKHFEFAEAT